jgi:hypothetical protein
MLASPALKRRYTPRLCETIFETDMKFEIHTDPED